jgi:meso-butanediol dehydrogenase/(S,S)-butanediol dehydrogenase/diacetyl reductase
MKALAGDVAIVTGAGQGIGFGIALAMARAGATIVVADLDGARGHAAALEIRDDYTAAGCGSEAVSVACDVGDHDQIQEVVARTVSEFGRLDIVVNNAHDVRVGALLDLTDSDVEASWRTGVWGAVALSQAAHPHLRDGGRIVNVVSSVMLKQSTAGFGLYAACKEAIRTITRNAAVEWAPDGIRVNALSPQARTPAWDEWAAMNPGAADRIRGEIPLARLGDPTEDIGEVAVFLASADSHYMTGSLVLADGGRGYLR